MTNITSVNSEISTLPVQIESQEALKAKTSLTNDLSKAAVCTIAWSVFSFAGEITREIFWGVRPSIEERLRHCRENNEICTFSSLDPLNIFKNYKNTKVAAEFILASKLSHIAFKSLGFKPPVIVSLAAGLAITVLLEGDFTQLEGAPVENKFGVPLPYRNVIFQEIANTFSKAVIMPIFGAGATTAAIVGVPLMVIGVPIVVMGGLSSLALLAENPLSGSASLKHVDSATDTNTESIETTDAIPESVDLMCKSSDFAKPAAE